MFGRLDYPDEDDLARRDRAIGIAGDEGAHVRYLVGDADAAGEHENRAVGGHAVDAAIGALCVGAGREDAARAGFGFLVEHVGEAGSAPDDERDGRSLGCEEILAGHCEAFLGREVVFRFGPGDGEGVGGPHADVGDVEEGVLAWLEEPGASHAQCDADCVTVEGFDVGGGVGGPHVAVEDGAYSSEALGKMLDYCYWSV